MRFFVKLHIVAFITLALATGCAGKWAEYNYGPGDYLAETFPSLKDGKGIEINNPDDYERLTNPEIKVFVVDDLTTICSGHANGCAIATKDWCEIYVGERASQKTMTHEYRHCYGWSHADNDTTNIPGYQWYPSG